MATRTKWMRSPVKRHGGGHFKAKKILPLLPPHRVYVEPFLGSGAMLLNKPKAEVEIAGDLDAGLIEVWWSLQGANAQHFMGALGEMGYDQATFDETASWVTSKFGPKRAVGYMVRNRMSRGAMGKAFAKPGAGEARLRGGRPDNVNAWETIKAELPAIAERVRDVTFHACDWGRVVANHWRDPYALIYMDSPYHHDTRTAKAVYEHEMGHSEHLGLLSWVTSTSAKVAMSGYRNDLYDAALKGWNLREFPMPNHSGQGRIKNRRTECLWTNF